MTKQELEKAYETLKKDYRDLQLAHSKLQDELEEIAIVVAGERYMRGRELRHKVQVMMLHAQLYQVIKDICIRLR